MGDRLRVAVGILGNATFLLLLAAPTLTFARIIRKKSTEEFSCVPYIVTLFSCLVYAWYGLPVISNIWENFPLVTVNGVGILLETSFICIYFYYGSTRGKKKVAAFVTLVIVMFCVTVAVSAFGLHDHHHRKIFVGSVGLVVGVAMYSSPLVAVRKVIETKSVEFMPFYLSFFAFLSCCVWTTYAVLSHDIFLVAPNAISCPIGLLQLVIYFVYRKSGNKEGPDKWNLHEDNNKLQLQPVPDESNQGMA